MNKYIFSISCLWLSVVCLALFWNIYDQRQADNLLALQTARAFFNQVIITRSWNSRHGGVYVPVDEQTQPNIYLDDPQRDLSTIQGILLTKINPAFMTRQISEIANLSKSGVKFHISSLKPIRPENEASDWEKIWLQSFELGEKEQGAFYSNGSMSSFRYMAPLMVEDSCLSCHVKQGYKKGIFVVALA